MKSKRKIWLGVGAFVIAGAGATGAASGPSDLRRAPADHAAGTTTAATSVPDSLLAQHGAPPADEGGEEGGEKGAAMRPPEIAFAVRIALLRGHLLVGDELVEQGQWNAALPHFLHPSEEIYGDIERQLADYRVPPFDAALAALTAAVKARKGGSEYETALTAVNRALSDADAGMKAKQGDWPGFTVKAAVETLRAAAGEYQAAIVDGRIAKPVEYQDARGFILQAERMIESVAADLQTRDAASLGRMRAALAALKQAVPSPMPPRLPLRAHGAVLSDVSRFELAAGPLM